MIAFFGFKDGEALYKSAQTRLGVDRGSDHEIFIVKFRLKLKKLGKTTKSYSYDFNKIPYNYTMRVTNKFKVLDMLERVPEEIWVEASYCNERGDQKHPHEKETQPSKMVF